MLELGDLLELVGGREPLLIEIKSEWEEPDVRFLQAIAKTAAVLSRAAGADVVRPGGHDRHPRAGAADPTRHRAGLFAGDCWWRGKLGPERAYSLTQFVLESGPAAPDFYAYDINALPTPGHALHARGLGAAAVHVDGANAGAARHGCPLGRRADLRGIRTLRARGRA